LLHESAIAVAIGDRRRHQNRGQRGEAGDSGREQLVETAIVRLTRYGSLV
jgi:hypothetical protein